VRHPAVEAMLLKDFAILNAFASVVDSIPGAEWLGLQARPLPLLSKRSASDDASPAVRDAFRFRAAHGARGPGRARARA
jgi:hypothetical protein